MRIFLIYLMAALTFSSCSLITGLTKQERTDNRVARKIEKLRARYPDSFSNFTETVSIDTVLPGFEFRGSSELFRWPVINDLLRDDTLYQKAVETLISSRNSSFDDVFSNPILVDTLGVRVFAKVDTGVLNLYVKKSEQEINVTKEVERFNTKEYIPKNKKNKLVFILVLIILLILYLYKK